MLKYSVFFWYFFSLCVIMDKSIIFPACFILSGSDVRIKSSITFRKISMLFIPYQQQRDPGCGTTEWRNVVGCLSCISLFAPYFHKEAET